MTTDANTNGNGQESAKSRYWISFDLGLMGDYSLFYRWLDSMGAEECGSGLATFTSTYSRDQLESEIRTVSSFSPRARIYIISKQDENIVGKFLAGGRKAAPWAGFAERSINVEDVA